jgi:hypothetical protein
VASHLTTYDVKRLGKPYQIADLLADIARAIETAPLKDAAPAAALAEIASKGAAAMAAKVQEATESFAIFRQKFLDRLSDPAKIDAQRTRLNAQEASSAPRPASSSRATACAWSTLPARP